MKDPLGIIDLLTQILILAVNELVCDTLRRLVLPSSERNTMLLIS